MKHNPSTDSEGAGRAANSGIKRHKMCDIPVLQGSGRGEITKCYEHEEIKHQEHGQVTAYDTGPVYITL